MVFVLSFVEIKFCSLCSKSQLIRLYFFLTKSINYYLSNSEYGFDVLLPPSHPLNSLPCIAIVD